MERNEIMQKGRTHMDVSNMVLLGSGAQADVYLMDGKAVKVFKPEYRNANPIMEADLQDKAHKKGLPVPAIYEVSTLDGRVTVVMEYLSGETLGEAMLRDMGDLHRYMGIAVDLQILVHQADGEGFPSQTQKLKSNINENGHLQDGQKEKLLHQLQGLPTGDRLCHGDFHVHNLMQTEGGVRIIDWTEAVSGSVAADVCRTYLLYLLYQREIAEVYLDLYCKKTGMPQEDALSWLPVIAGARLNENATKEDVALLLSLVDHGKEGL